MTIIISLGIASTSPYSFNTGKEYSWNSLTWIGAGEIIIQISSGSASVFDLIVAEPTAPVSFVVTAGDNQAVAGNTQIPIPLSATGVDQYGNGVWPCNVTYVAPSSGASGIFPSGTKNKIGKKMKFGTSATVNSLFQWKSLLW